ncbi:MAG: hypothetical protein ACYSVY_16195 [Planctomycetota bacterium]|jgi:hypothetical protein
MMLNLAIRVCAWSIVGLFGSGTAWAQDGDGSIVDWGRNGAGQCDVPVKPSSVAGEPLFIGQADLPRSEISSSIYWATASRRSIKRSALASPVVEHVLSAPTITVGIALDVPGGKVYWTGIQPSGIFRANLDGTGIEQLIGVCGPTGGCSYQNVTLDLVAGKMYWTEDGTSEDFYGLRRANVDGSDVEDVIPSTFLTRPDGIALDLVAGKIYWAENWAQGALGDIEGRIRRANLDGSEVEDLLAVGGNTFGLQLDVADGRMYWTDNNAGEVRRANLDGTMAELLLGGLDYPLGLALHLSAGRMYVAEYLLGKILRANLDGTNVQEFLITEPDPVLGLALDVAEVELMVYLDIKPGSCPNPLNRSSHGVVPVARLGTAYFDATMIDVSSVRLLRADGIGGEVAPNEGPPGPHSEIEDVGTPFEGEACECHDLAGNGIDDLPMKFRTDEVVEALDLDDLANGEELELVLTGQLMDGTEFTSAGDCILIVPPAPPPGILSVESTVAGAWIDVSPPDEVLDTGGFADFERSFPVSTVVTLTAEAEVNGRPLVGWLVNGVMQSGTQSSDPSPFSYGDLVGNVIEVTILENETVRALYAKRFSPTSETGAEQPGPGIGSEPGISDEPPGDDKPGTSSEPGTGSEQGIGGEPGIGSEPGIGGREG